MGVCVQGCCQSPSQVSSVLLTLGVHMDHHFHSRVEITQILKYMVLQAAGRAFSDVAASPLIVFLIVVLSVLNGVQLSLSFAIFILPMSGLVIFYTICLLTRAFIDIFDANTSVKRIQVLIKVSWL